MNYNYRLKNIYKNVVTNKEYTIQDLVQPGFKYTGKPFKSFQDIYKHFNIKDEILTNEQMQILYDKGLIDVSINDVISEMKRCM